MKKVVFDIPYPADKKVKSKWTTRFGTNSYYSGKVWQQRNKDKDYFHSLVCGEMERQKVRKYPYENPVTITLFVNDRLDIDNHSIILKYVIDAMKGRVIRDDNRTWVQGVEMYFHDEDCIRVCVREA